MEMGPAPDFGHVGENPEGNRPISSLETFGRDQPLPWARQQLPWALKSDGGFEERRRRPPGAEGRTRLGGPDPTEVGVPHGPAPCSFPRGRFGTHLQHPRRPRGCCPALLLLLGRIPGRGPPPCPTPGSARDAPSRALHPEEPHGDPKEVQLPARPRCPDAAAWRALCGLDVGEVKKMFLITASSCLAFLHHSQLIKHFLLLSTHPHPASLPPAHRAPAPSWLLSLVPLLPPLSLPSCFPKFS